MSKRLQDYIAESQQWIENPVPGDDFAINFREECLVKSYVLETRPGAVVIQADEEMLRIMESYGCSLEDLEEQQSVDDVLVSEDPTEEEPTAPGTMGAVTEPTAYDPIGEDFVGRMMELAGCGRKAMEGDISQIEKDIADAPVAPMGTVEEELDEAEYQGRKVPLGKPMRGDVKKFKVYVKDPKTGNVKKVNFGHGGTSAKRAGQKTMKIKKSDPARRKSFRARHNCDNPGPRTKARYWSCRAW